MSKFYKIVLGGCGSVFAVYGLYKSENIFHQHPVVMADGNVNRPKLRLPSRDEQLNLLKTTPEYDVLVIGGGATGAGAALDSISRGLKTALIELDDFSSGTSSRSTKLIHGGVRYLQKAILQFDLEQYRMVKEALHERANLLSIAPHLSYPLPIMLPIYSPKRSSLDGRFNKFNQAGSTSSFNRGDKLKTDDKSERPPVSCYGCGKLDVTNPRCSNCKPIANRDSENFGNISLNSYSPTPNQIEVLKLAVNSIWGTACADSGANHSIAGETLHLLLQREGANFQKIQLSISLADDHKSEGEVYTTSLVVPIEVYHTSALCPHQDPSSKPLTPL
ncbi:glycerol-3-phosphate dehydrogenase, mitochondrial [Trichonephila clavipes]|nr:glycerol-3-phosphate dehydrogenase, mitochondrial [Trichonephila clavipes]